MQQRRVASRSRSDGTTLGRARRRSAARCRRRLREASASQIAHPCVVRSVPARRTRAGARPPSRTEVLRASWSTVRWLTALGGASTAPSGRGASPAPARVGRAHRRGGRLVRHQYDRAVLVRDRPHQPPALRAACTCGLPVGSSASMSTGVLTSARDCEPVRLPMGGSRASRRRLLGASESTSRRPAGGGVRSRAAYAGR